MSVQPLPVTPRERDVLRRELGWYTATLEDLAHEVQRGRLDSRLRWRAHVALWLLDDLGWQHEDPRDEFFVTLPRDELAHWLRDTLEETELGCEYERQGLLEVDESAASYHRHFVAAGYRDVPSVQQLADEHLADARRELDELLELRLVVTSLLERQEAAR